MGRGIALVYALNGCRVNLYDTASAALERALGLIDADLALMVEEGLCTDAGRLDALEKILVTDSLAEAVGPADFIIEAVPEQLELKWQVFSAIENFAPPGAIIASNTSTLPLSELNRCAQYPERMIVTHFFNPAHLVPLVEVVKAEYTPPQVIADTLAFLRRAGKAPVVLKKEVPGFIANRLQAAVLREALHLVHSGIADRHDVDTAMTCGPGFRWPFIGPLETADFGGLDTWRSVMNNLAPVLGDSRAASALLEELNGRGHLGVKTGQGFYAYPTGEDVAARIRYRDRAFMRLLKLRSQT
jgi:3-hydroxyacyl-CoA dehydrogenase